MNSKDNNITAKMIQAGNDIASACFDAQINKALKVPEDDDFVADGPNKDLVEAYVKEEITSVEAISIMTNFYLGTKAADYVSIFFLDKVTLA